MVLVAVVAYATDGLVRASKPLFIEKLYSPINYNQNRDNKKSDRIVFGQNHNT